MEIWVCTNTYGQVVYIFWGFPLKTWTSFMIILGFYKILIRNTGYNSVKIILTNNSTYSKLSGSILILFRLEKLLLVLTLLLEVINQ